MATKKKPTVMEKIDWRQMGPAPVIGVDEVGRGCLAGPVYAGAAILLSDAVEAELTDSKLLNEDKRERLSIDILKQHKVCVAWATEDEIETLNIFQASLLAMKRAVEGLGVTSGHILVDGKFAIPGMKNFIQTPLIKGDLRATPISAAAICAKVARDHLMHNLAKEYPGYGFEKHKGYATEDHRMAIQKLGPCKVHRRSFGGVREFLGAQSLSM
jgi:ribonuclease HII